MPPPSTASFDPHTAEAFGLESKPLTLILGRMGIAYICGADGNPSNVVYPNF